MSLSGQQHKQLQKALIDAFPNKALLEQMLLFELDKNLDTIAEGSNLEVVVFKLIRTADSQGWIEDLVTSACKSNPGNSSLRAISQEINNIKSPKSREKDRIRDDLLNSVSEKLDYLFYSSLPNDKRIHINLLKQSQPDR